MKIAFKMFFVKQRAFALWLRYFCTGVFNRHWISVCGILTFSIPVCSGQFRYTGKSFATRSEVIAQHGMAATSHPLATQVAIDILQKGGTAIDAAIAANCMLGLVEPTGNGLGGDLFALIWDARTQKLYGLNGSGRSPRSLTKDYFKQQRIQKIPTYGALSVSVPGCVDGWYAMHERFGKLPMPELLQPTVKYARQGFPVTEVIAFLWKEYANTLHTYPGFAKTYMPGNKAPEKGEIFKNIHLANTLERIIEGGKDAFYKGVIAAAIERTVKSAGGFLSREDLMTHKSEWVTPVSTDYRGYQVWQLPPNSQGLAVLQMLNILEGCNIREMGFGSADYIHHFVEAKKLAFEDRAAYYADPAFHEVPVEALLNKDYAERRRRLIDPGKAKTDYRAGDIEKGNNTICLSVADNEGNMVSLIQSNFAGMGSGIVPGELGFSLQNRGSAFSLEEGRMNTYAPGKRPFHTLIPGFVTKKERPYVSFGVMGGDMQPLGQVQIIVNLIDFDMNLQEAGDAPRINHEGSSTPAGEAAQRNGGRVFLENGFAPEVIIELMKRGHHAGYDLRHFGGYQAIKWDAEKKVYYGASESRKDGHAAGY